MNQVLVIEKRPSPNHSSRRGATVDVILLHHTAGSDGQKDVEWLCNPASQVSAHYLVDRDGTLYQLVEEDRAAWHAGQCALRGEATNMNTRSIGVEISNKGDGAEPYTEAQYKALELLVPFLVGKYGVRLENVLGHREVAIPKGRKTDPSDNFDFARVRAAVQQATQSPGA